MKGIGVVRGGWERCLGLKADLCVLGYFGYGGTGCGFSLF